MPRPKSASHDVASARPRPQSASHDIAGARARPLSASHDLATRPRPKSASRDVAGRTHPARDSPGRANHGPGKSSAVLGGSQALSDDTPLSIPSHSPPLSRPRSPSDPAGARAYGGASTAAGPEPGARGPETWGADAKGMDMHSLVTMMAKVKQLRGALDLANEREVELQRERNAETRRMREEADAAARAMQGRIEALRWV